PLFALRECLFEEFKIRKRLHSAHAFAEQLLAEQAEVEAAFQVMHAGLQKAFSVQPDPKPNGAELSRCGKALTREVDAGLFRIQINVTKSDDSFNRMLKNLSAPTGLGAGVITLAPFEAEFLERQHQRQKMRP